MDVEVALWPFFGGGQSNISLWLAMNQLNWRWKMSEGIEQAIHAIMNVLNADAEHYALSFTACGPPHKEDAARQ